MDIHSTAFDIFEEKYRDTKLYWFQKKVLISKMIHSRKRNSKKKC